MHTRSNRVVLWIIVIGAMVIGAFLLLGKNISPAPDNTDGSNTMSAQTIGTDLTTVGQDLNSITLENIDTDL